MILDPDAVVMGNLDLLRPVAAAGLRSIVASFDVGTRHSRHCRASFDLTSPAVDMERSARELCDLGRSLRTRPVLYYSNDAQLLMVSRHREELGHYFRFLMPGPDLVEDLVDKARFHLLGSRHGFPIPRTLLVPAGDPSRLESPWGFPCVVKPVTRVGWYEAQVMGKVPHKVLKVESAEDLARAVQTMRTHARDFVLQEFVGGGDDQIYSFHGYFDRSCEPLAWFVGRKVRTYPIDTGKSTCLELAHEPEMAKLAIACLREIGFQGVVKVDFKRDPRSGLFQMLEVNPRFNLWHDLGAVSGVNLPLVAHRYLEGSWSGPPPEYHVGHYWISLPLDFMAIWSAFRHGRLSLRKWISSYLGRNVCNTFAWDDPLPALSVAFNLSARSFRRLRGKRRGGGNRAPPSRAV